MTITNNKKAINTILYNDKTVFLPILIWNISEKTCMDCIPTPLLYNYYWKQRKVI